MKRLSARDYAHALAEAVADSPTRQRREIVQNFLSLLRRQRASHLLPRIMDHLQHLDDAAARTTRVKLTSAMETDTKAVIKALEKALGAVVVDAVVDPQLVGGVAIRVGDTLIDGSIQAQLQSLRTHLMTSHA